MRHFAAGQIDAALDFPSLIDALGEAFRGGFHAPQRHHHEIERAGEPAAIALLMPAWTTAGASAGDYLGVKIVNVFPGNAARGLPAVSRPLRAAIGRHRRADRHNGWNAADGVAHRRGVRAGGALSRAPRREEPAHRRRRRDWRRSWRTRTRASGRSSESRCGTIARRARAGSPKALSAEGFRAHAVEHLQDAVAEADIISCATLSQAPLIAGAWLEAGQHLDLVGAFSMRMREADDAALKRARVFVDTDAALSEGGDVALALQSGALTRADVVADLAALVRGAPGRGGDEEITLFKSVGAAIEDLAAAMLVWRKAGGGKF